MAFLLALLLVANSDPGPALAQALSYEQRGDDAGALSAVERLVAADPSAPLPRLEAARLRLKGNLDLDRAQVHLEAARAAAPENPRVHYLWGLLEQERGRTEQAAKNYELALVYRQDYEDARSRLAGLRFAQSDFTRAEPLYRDLALAHPGEVGAQLQWVACLESLGRDDEAEVELKKLLRLAPPPAAAAQRLAGLYDRTGRAAQATKVRSSAGLGSNRKLRPLPKSRR